MTSKTDESVRYDDKGIHAVGRKDDQQKERWDLLPVELLEDTVRVMTYGAQRYGDNNWQQVENGADRYYAAMMRHIYAFRKGIKVDSDSGLPHLAHAICNLIFMDWFGGKDEKEQQRDHEGDQCSEDGEERAFIGLRGEQVGTSRQ